MRDDTPTPFGEAGVTSGDAQNPGWMVKKTPNFREISWQKCVSTPAMIILLF
jgi:hypothetical protein